MNNKVLAVILSYHPEEKILHNAKALLEQVSQVVVVDNESTEASKKLLQQLPQNRVAFVWNEQNLGVATGFNQGIRWGLEQGFDWFLLMDQDSQAAEGMVETLLSVAERENKSGLALVGPHHEDYNRKIDAKYESEISPAPLLITSGSLLSRRLIEEIGFYDDRLFIDHVDHDYCLRLQKKGGQSLKVNGAVLYHRFGQAKVKTVFGKSFFLQEYSPFRRYHMMRNRIVLYKRFGLFSGEWFWMDFRSAWKDLVKLILFESQKGPKLMAVAKGFIDGLRWNEAKDQRNNV